MGLQIYDKFRKKTYIVFGSGTAAQSHIGQFKRLGCKLVAVYNPSGRGVLGQQREALVSFSALDKIKPDFFVIASPNQYHLEHIEYTIGRGIPSLVEKPTIKDEAGLIWLKKNIDKVSRLCMSGQNLRFQRNTIFLKEWLKKQKNLPDRVHVEWCRDIWESIEPWKKNLKMSGGGVLLDWGPHALDLVLELFPYLEFKPAKCDLEYDTYKMDLRADVLLKSQINNLSASATLSWSTTKTGKKPLALYLHYKDQLLTWQKTGSIILTTPTTQRHLFDKKGDVMHKHFLTQYVKCQNLTEQKIEQMKNTIDLLEQIIKLYSDKNQRV